VRKLLHPCRLDLQVRPAIPALLNEPSYGVEYQEGLEGPTLLSGREVEETRAKTIYGDVTVKTPVIFHNVLLARNEVISVPSIT